MKHLSRKERLNKERTELLRHLQDLLEGPMVVLGFLWLVLLIMDLVKGLTPLLELLSSFIWVIFILDFGLKLLLAPSKTTFLKTNWLTVISLLIPALRILRLVRAFRLLSSLRAIRGLRLVKVIGSLNRGLKSLGTSMRRRGFGYVLASTLLVTLLGSGGMYAFEKEVASGFKGYGEALWWTLMLLSSLGSEYWPQTPEGRILCFLLALFGLAVFGYFTATLATYFIGRDAEDEAAEIAGTKQIENLQQEVAALRREIQILVEKQTGK
ncbi:potassium channel family protein [Adhaeribacter radiodurans]|uniref:Ion transporter n=1 Tax=Adhaeribacter radiodurans TaxID=2745197 RepID=A0A7L7L407_9BACT|nr:potassium channel family protein [Adhaeribacter radiodurans]QMU27099.1 ion transporter [Adhaeribacter radiodurans]